MSALVGIVSWAVPGRPVLAQLASPAAIVLKPSCGNLVSSDGQPTPAHSVNVDGSNFNPFTAILISFDAGPGGRPQSFQARTDGFGRFNVDIAPSSRSAGTYVVRADDLKQREAIADFKVPCPLLVLQPPIGPPGFVTLAVGTGFHPNASVTLAWAPPALVLQPPGLVMTDQSGGFRIPVLISYREALGRRALKATTVREGRSRESVAGFLVVPGRGQPADFRDRR